MTLCLGWKSKTAAFLIADSVVTCNKNESKNIFQETSFGEKQGDFNKKYIYEKSLKLYSVDKIAITFAGDADFGNEMVNLIKDNLDYGRNIKESIEFSIKNYTDFCSCPHVQILVACCEDKPIIYSIDNKISSVINEEDFISFGSPPEHLKEHLASFYNSFKISRENEFYSNLADETFLLKMIALLQVYGIHNCTIEKNGIGGAYSGLYITKEKIHWQPDSYYLIHNENPAFEEGFFTALYIRKNCQFIITKERNMVLENHSKNKKSMNHVAELETIFEEVANSFDNGIFKYIIFLNLKRHVATILHMDYKHYHNFLFIDIEESKKGKVALLIKKELEYLINDNYSFANYPVIQHIPYIPISEEHVEAIKNILPEARISKCYGYLSVYRGYIYKNGTAYKEYHLELEKIFAFIKHYSNEEMIYIVNRSSDLLELEYKDGVILFPDIKMHEMETIFSNIPDKTTDKNMYLFDVLTNDETGLASVQYTIKILTNNWKDAEKKAELQAQTEFGNIFILTRIGIEFYCPPY